MLKAILELTKENEGDDIFYRYNIDGTKVWFMQQQDNGNIYTVSIRPGDEFDDIVEFYMQDDYHSDVYYPLGIEICTRQRLTLKQMDEYIDLMQHTKEVATAIMNIFESGIHKECYDKFHKEMVE